jgi:hypothetical protein
MDRSRKGKLPAPAGQVRSGRSEKRKSRVVSKHLGGSVVALGVILLSAGAAAAAEQAEDALRATVRITRGSVSGTGFFVATGDKADSGPRHLLVTAAHVFNVMDGPDCTVVFRARGKASELVRKEVGLTIRDGKKPRWVQHPEIDVAVIAMDLPEGVDVKAFADRQIAGAQLAADRKVRVGQDVCIPCYPAKLEANEAGWPILRKGAIASHPLTPLAGAKTMFVDYANFGGDSGAPVVAWIEKEAVVVGLVTGMQRQSDRSSTPFEERTVHTPLHLAIAVQSPFIRQTIEQWRKQK